MTPDGFRAIALSLPEAAEAEHMHHPDFRVRGKIFATLGYPDAGWGVVMVTPADQALLVAAAPRVFVPVKGGWGLRGATCVRLRGAKEALVRRALTAAWRHRAPKRLAASLPE